MLHHAAAHDHLCIVDEARDRPGILGVERGLAGARVEAIDVEQRGIAPVRRDEHAVGTPRIERLHIDARALVRRKVDLLAAAVRIGREKMEVLVTAGVLQVQHAGAVG